MSNIWPPQLLRFRQRWTCRGIPRCASALVEAGSPVVSFSAGTIRPLALLAEHRDHAQSRGARLREPDLRRKEGMLDFFRTFQNATAPQPARIGTYGTPFTISIIETQIAAARKYRPFIATPPLSRPSQTWLAEPMRGWGRYLNDCIRLISRSDLDGIVPARTAKAG